MQSVALGRVKASAPFRPPRGCAGVLIERIFRDIDDMRPGIDFVEAIDEVVGTCAIDPGERVLFSQ